VEDYTQTTVLNDWQSLKAECIIRPGQKYITVNVGYWSGGVKWGEFEAKDLVIKVDGLALSEAFPQLYSSASQSCQYNRKTGATTLDAVVDDGGSVSFESNKIALASPSSDVRAYVASRWYAVKSGVVILRTRSKLVSGYTALATIDFKDASGTIALSRSFNINTDDEDHLIVIQVPDEALMARAVVGFHTSAMPHGGGNVDLYDFKFEVYSSDVSSALESYPVCATLKKEAGGWKVDPRFVAMNVSSASVSG
ncbi:hypothetical protein ABUU23_18775, partial [Vibrio cholerae]